MFKKETTKYEILSHIKVLQHTTRIVQPGRTFLSRMYDTAAKLRELHFYTRLNREFQSDLCWWDIFFKSWNGLSLLQCTDNCNPRLQYSDRCVRFLGLWGLLSGKMAVTRVALSILHSTHHVQGITTHCSQLCCVGPITGSIQNNIPV